MPVTTMSATSSSCAAGGCGVTWPRAMVEADRAPTAEAAKSAERRWFWRNNMTNPSPAISVRFSGKVFTGNAISGNQSRKSAILSTKI